ncbi:MAG: hypothetical protein JNM63_06815 [Spirochaetia bacterium]|nr:hypothetical protein [Spirochaetia bacterium]
MRRVLLFLLIPGLLSLSGLNLWLIEGADALHRIVHEIGERGSEGLSRVWDGTHRCDRDEGFANAKKLDKKTASLLLKEKKNPSDQMEGLFLFHEPSVIHLISVPHTDKPVFLRTDPPTPPPIS